MKPMSLREKAERIYPDIEEFAESLELQVNVLEPICTLLSYLGWPVVLFFLILAADGAWRVWKYPYGTEMADFLVPVGLALTVLMAKYIAGALSYG